MGETRYRGDSSSEGLTGAERRVYERQAMSATAQVVDVDSGTSITAQTSNVSRGGCFLDAPGPLSKGADVRVLLAWQDRRFESAGRVAHAGQGIGIAFRTVRPEQQRILDSWLA